MIHKSTNSLTTELHYFHFHKNVKAGNEFECNTYVHEGQV